MIKAVIQMFVDEVGSENNMHCVAKIRGGVIVFCCVHALFFVQFSFLGYLAAVLLSIQRCLVKECTKNKAGE